MKPTRTYATLQYEKKKTGYIDWFYDEERPKLTDFTTVGNWGKAGNYFHLYAAEPHVLIKLKGLFEGLRKSEFDNFYFPDNEETCNDLSWFIERFPMQMDDYTRKKLAAGKAKYLKDQKNIEFILSEAYTPATPKLKEPYAPRPYQSKGAEVFFATKKMLLLDELGLGKSLTSILPMVMQPKKVLPAVIICQTHLPSQWKKDTIEKFTDMKAYIIPTGRSTDKGLPAADVYICPYSRLTKWAGILREVVKYAIFDEVQELRVAGSDKYNSAMSICSQIEYVQGLSGTPIYNYGVEIFNILDCIRPGVLGSRDHWCREWGWREITNARALGTYLRERNLTIRRTNKEVDRELPQLNTIIKTVEADESEVESANKLATQLAMSYLTSTNFAEKGQYAREFDLRARQLTGIAKAHSVAALVKILLENGKPVLLSGWHRDVYEIWMNDLYMYKPVMYTGSETAAQKDEAKRQFCEGETNLMIISNRSGAGLDGLQHRCTDVVIGELDWSPKVHEQIVGRVNRDGQTQHVTVYYPICDYGSDETMVEILGLKSAQAHMIVDPHLGITEQYGDENRIRLLAENYLKKAGIDTSKLSVDKDGKLNDENDKAA